MADFLVRNAGSVVGFKATDHDALDWLNENVDSAPYQWLADWLYVDHRYAADLADGIADAGFTLAPSL